MLSLEDATSRMTRLGRSEITDAEHLSIDDVVARIEAVELDQVHEIAAAFYDGPFVLGAVGPFEPGDLEEFIA